MVLIGAPTFIRADLVARAKGIPTGQWRWMRDRHALDGFVGTVVVTPGWDRDDQELAAALSYAKHCGFVAVEHFGFSEP